MTTLEEARAALADICRTSGDPASITDALAVIDAAKNDRTASDNKALNQGGEAARSGLRLTSMTRVEPVQANHSLLLAAQVNEARDFVREHGPARLWDVATTDDYDRLLRRHREAHLSLGCSGASSCTGARLG